MTSLIFFGTIIILLGIIIVCFYNKSFENSSDINEGFAAGIIDSKDYLDSKKRVINYNPSPVSEGYVLTRVSRNNKIEEIWILYQNAKPPASKKAAYIPQGPVVRNSYASSWSRMR